MLPLSSSSESGVVLPVVVTIFCLGFAWVPGSRSRKKTWVFIGYYPILEWFIKWLL